MLVSDIPGSIMFLIRITHITHLSNYPSISFSYNSKTKLRIICSLSFVSLSPSPLQLKWSRCLSLPHLSSSPSVMLISLRHKFIDLWIVHAPSFLFSSCPLTHLYFLSTSIFHSCLGAFLHLLHNLNLPNHSILYYRVVFYHQALQSEGKQQLLRWMFLAEIKPVTLSTILLHWLKICCIIFLINIRIVWYWSTQINLKAKLSIGLYE